MQWFSWNQRWPFSRLISSVQNMWWWVPSLLAIKSESNLDKVSAKFLYVISVVWLQYIVKPPNQPIFRFHTDNGPTSQGFHVQYTALNFSTDCGENFFNYEGILTSPSYPQQYQELQSCVYVISQPNLKAVNFTFVTMDVNCQGFPSDYVEMRDGDSEDSPLLGKFCGNGSNVPQFMKTSQKHLRIR